MKVLHDEEMGVIKDWRKALRNPPAYRIANRTLRNQTNFVLWVSITGLTVLVILYVLPKKSNLAAPHYSKEYYNSTYPLTKPITTNGMQTFRIGIITDLDTNSKSEKEPYTWYAYFKKGYLSYTPQRHALVLSWDKNEPTRLTTSYALKDRGMELSELVVFNGKLLTFDDRTGLIFEIAAEKAVPWILLTDGDGQNNKGFKSEWATVKGNQLYVGSMGKEWTTPAGDFENNNPQYVKEISTRGEVKHIPWIVEYNRIREILGINWPGYMIHESGVWSSVHKRWFFLPRRCSKETYNETLDEHRGCSVLITANEEMQDVQIVHLPNSTPTRGFSSFKFVPSSDDEVIVALRTEELNGKTATYVTSFTIKGQILLNDTWISDLKYEGLEFI
ncbi:hypothetical protein AMK59_7103 [Oryctes borbonicus]|uniref:Apyrase n=1 Tax=Oryctes borbonicus TaxID=1629725 RepID=A0A0T6AU84_9SCAR|nr:hypothetical protein AMK59_7103 [Oryctes borbonicus]